MENINVIEFHRTRDFSQKLSITFEFIKQNFKSLFKSILIIAGPPVLLASLLIGSFFGDFISLTQQAALNQGQAEELQSYFLSVNFWLQLLLMGVFLTISSVMNIATINNYLLLYGERKTNKIEVSEVWDRVRSTFWMYFSTMFLFMFLAIATYILLVLLVVGMGVLSPFLAVIGGIGVFCALMYLIFGASLTFFVRAYERRGFFEAVLRSFKLVKDKWWSTFGLIFILYFILMVVSYLFMIPWYVVMGVTAFHSTSTEVFSEPSSTFQTGMLIFFTLYYLVQMILTALPNIGIAFQYFNLVELKEAKGLMTQIETLGQTLPPSTTQDEHY